MLQGKNVLASTNDLVAVPTLFIPTSTELDTDATLHVIQYNDDINSFTFG
jgi:hypothetical protein